MRFYIRSCYWRQWTLYVCLLLDLVIDDNKYFRFYFRSCYWRQWTLDVCCRILLLATALHTINVLCSPYIPSSHHWLHIKKGVWSHNMFGHTIFLLYFFWQIQQRKILVGVWSHVCVTKITYSEIFLTNSTKENKRGFGHVFVWQKIIYFSDKFNACKCKGKYQSPLQENVCDWLFCGFQAIYNSSRENLPNINLRYKCLFFGWNPFIIPPENICQWKIGKYCSCDISN